MRKLIAFAGIVSLGLSACGGDGAGGSQKTPAGPPTGQEKPKPGDGGDKTATSALVIQVFREDSDTGIAADIDRLDDTGNSHYFATVNDTGVAKLAQPCSAADRFQAEPRVEAYLRVAPQPCGATVTFRLYSAQATYEMIRIAQDDERAGNFASAQAKFGQAAERLQYSKPLDAEKLRLRVNVNAAKVLGVDHPTTTVNGKETASPQLSDRIKRFQEKAHLPATGQIDKPTRERLLTEKHP